jgi:hypothetical protein
MVAALNPGIFPYLGRLRFLPSSAFFPADFPFG